MDACAVSQFEQHIRAVAGWPLGDPARHSDVVMTNLLGDEADPGTASPRKPGAASTSTARRKPTGAKNGPCQSPGPSTGLRVYGIARPIEGACPFKGTRSWRRSSPNSQIKQDSQGPLVQVIVRDNNVDQALKALKKKMQREGIFREMKLRGHYEKPSEEARREKAEAVRRARKLARKRLQREGLLPMPKKLIKEGEQRRGRPS